MDTLKTLPPNLLEVAKKQMIKFVDKINLPETINESESEFYHVVIVTGAFNQATLETKYSSSVKKYNKRSWLTSKTRLGQLGYTNVHIIHDPTVKAGEATGEAEKGKTETKTKSGGNTEAKEYRQNLIAQAKELGWEGALNGKNSIYEEFIVKAKETQGADDTEA